MWISQHHTRTTMPLTISSTRSPTLYPSNTPPPHTCRGFFIGLFLLYVIAITLCAAEIPLSHRVTTTTFNLSTQYPLPDEISPQIVVYPASAGVIGIAVAIPLAVVACGAVAAGIVVVHKKRKRRRDEQAAAAAAAETANINDSLPQNDSSRFSSPNGADEIELVTHYQPNTLDLLRDPLARTNCDNNDGSVPDSYNEHVLVPISPSHHHSSTSKQPFKSPDVFVSPAPIVITDSTTLYSPSHWQQDEVYSFRSSPVASADKRSFPATTGGAADVSAIVPRASVLEGSLDGRSLEECLTRRGSDLNRDNDAHKYQHQAALARAMSTQTLQSPHPSSPPSVHSTTTSNSSSLASGSDHIGDVEDNDQGILPALPPHMITSGMSAIVSTHDGVPIAHPNSLSQFNSSDDRGPAMTLRQTTTGGFTHDIEQQYIDTILYNICNLSSSDSSNSHSFHSDTSSDASSHSFIDPADPDHAMIVTANSFLVSSVSGSQRFGLPPVSHGATGSNPHALPHDDPLRQSLYAPGGRRSMRMNLADAAQVSKKTGGTVNLRKLSTTALIRIQDRLCELRNSTLFEELLPTNQNDPNRSILQRLGHPSSKFHPRNINCRHHCRWFAYSQAYHFSFRADPAIYASPYYTGETASGAAARSGNNPSIGNIPHASHIPLVEQIGDDLPWSHSASNLSDISASAATAAAAAAGHHPVPIMKESSMPSLDALLRASQSFQLDSQQQRLQHQPLPPDTGVPPTNTSSAIGSQPIQTNSQLHNVTLTPLRLSFSTKQQRRKSLGEHDTPRSISHQKNTTTTVGAAGKPLMITAGSGSSPGLQFPHQTNHKFNHHRHHNHPQHVLLSPRAEASSDEELNVEPTTFHRNQLHRHERPRKQPSDLSPSHHRSRSSSVPASSSRKITQYNIDDDDDDDSTASSTHTPAIGYASSSGSSTPIDSDAREQHRVPNSQTAAQQTALDIPVHPRRFHTPSRSRSSGPGFSRPDARPSGYYDVLRLSTAMHLPAPITAIPLYPSHQPSSTTDQQQPAQQQQHRMSITNTPARRGRDIWLRDDEWNDDDDDESSNQVQPLASATDYRPEQQQLNASGFPSQSSSRPDEGVRSFADDNRAEYLDRISYLQELQSHMRQHQQEQHALRLSQPHLSQQVAAFQAATQQQQEQQQRQQLQPSDQDSASDIPGSDMRLNTINTISPPHRRPPSTPDKQDPPIRPLHFKGFATPPVHREQRPRTTALVESVAVPPGSSINPALAGPTGPIFNHLPTRSSKVAVVPVHLHASSRLPIADQYHFTGNTPALGAAALISSSSPSPNLGWMQSPAPSSSMSFRVPPPAGVAAAAAAAASTTITAVTSSLDIPLPVRPLHLIDWETFSGFCSCPGHEHSALQHDIPSATPSVCSHHAPSSSFSSRPEGALPGGGNLGALRRMRDRRQFGTSIIAPPTILNTPSSRHPQYISPQTSPRYSVSKRISVWEDYNNEIEILLEQRGASQRIRQDEEDRLNNTSFVLNRREFISTWAPGGGSQHSSPQLPPAASQHSNSHTDALSHSSSIHSTSHSHNSTHSQSTTPGSRRHRGPADGVGLQLRPAAPPHLAIVPDLYSQHDVQELISPRRAQPMFAQMWDSQITPSALPTLDWTTSSSPSSLQGAGAAHASQVGPNPNTGSSTVSNQASYTSGGASSGHFGPNHAALATWSEEPDQSGAAHLSARLNGDTHSHSHSFTLSSGRPSLRLRPSFRPSLRQSNAAFAPHILHPGGAAIEHGRDSFFRPSGHGALLGDSSFRTSFFAANMLTLGSTPMKVRPFASQREDDYSNSSSSGSSSTASNTRRASQHSAHNRASLRVSDHRTSRHYSRRAQHPSSTHFVGLDLATVDDRGGTDDVVVLPLAEALRRAGKTPRVTTKSPKASETTTAAVPQQQSTTTLLVSSPHGGKPIVKPVVSHAPAADTSTAAADHLVVPLDFSSAVLAPQHTSPLGAGGAGGTADKPSTGGGIRLLASKFFSRHDHSDMSDAVPQPMTTQPVQKQTSATTALVSPSAFVTSEQHGEDVFDERQPYDFPTPLTGPMHTPVTRPRTKSTSLFSRLKSSLMSDSESEMTAAALAAANASMAAHTPQFPDNSGKLGPRATGPAAAILGTSLPGTMQQQQQPPIQTRTRRRSSLGAIGDFIGSTFDSEPTNNMTVPPRELIPVFHPSDDYWMFGLIYPPAVDEWDFWSVASTISTTSHTESNSFVHLPTTATSSMTGGGVMPSPLPTVTNKDSVPPTSATLRVSSSRMLQPSFSQLRTSASRRSSGQLPGIPPPNNTTIATTSIAIHPSINTLELSQPDFTPENIAEHDIDNNTTAITPSSSSLQPGAMVVHHSGINRSASSDQHKHESQQPLSTTAKASPLPPSSEFPEMATNASISTLLPTRLPHPSTDSTSVDHLLRTGSDEPALDSQRSSRLTSTSWAAVQTFQRTSSSSAQFASLDVSNLHPTTPSHHDRLASSTSSPTTLVQSHSGQQFLRNHQHHHHPRPAVPTGSIIPSSSTLQTIPSPTNIATADTLQKSTSEFFPAPIAPSRSGPQIPMAAAAAASNRTSLKSNHSNLLHGSSSGLSAHHPRGTGSVEASASPSPPPSNFVTWEKYCQTRAAQRSHGMTLILPSPVVQQAYMEQLENTRRRDHARMIALARKQPAATAIGTIDTKRGKVSVQVRSAQAAPSRTSISTKPSFVTALYESATDTETDGTTSNLSTAEPSSAFMGRSSLVSQPSSLGMSFRPTGISSLLPRTGSNLRPSLMNSRGSQNDSMMSFASLGTSGGGGNNLFIGNFPSAGTNPPVRPRGQGSLSHISSFVNTTPGNGLNPSPLPNETQNNGGGLLSPDFLNHPYGLVSPLPCGLPPSPTLSFHNVSLAFYNHHRVQIQRRETMLKSSRPYYLPNDATLPMDSHSHHQHRHHSTHRSTTGSSQLPFHPDTPIAIRAVNSNSIFHNASARAIITHFGGITNLPTGWTCLSHLNYYGELILVPPPNRDIKHFARADQLRRSIAKGIQYPEARDANQNLFYANPVFASRYGIVHDISPDTHRFARDLRGELPLWIIEMDKRELQQPPPDLRFQCWATELPPPRSPPLALFWMTFKHFREKHVYQPFELTPVDIIMRICNGHLLYLHSREQNIGRASLYNAIGLAVAAMYIEELKKRYTQSSSIPSKVLPKPKPKFRGSIFGKKQLVREDPSENEPVENNAIPDVPAVKTVPTADDGTVLTYQRLRYLENSSIGLARKIYLGKSFRAYKTMKRALNYKENAAFLAFDQDDASDSGAGGTISGGPLPTSPALGASELFSRRQSGLLMATPLTQPMSPSPAQYHLPTPELSADNNSTNHSMPRTMSFLDLHPSQPEGSSPSPSLRSLGSNSKLPPLNDTLATTQHHLALPRQSTLSLDISDRNSGDAAHMLADIHRFRRMSTAEGLLPTMPEEDDLIPDTPRGTAGGIMRLL